MKTQAPKSRKNLLSFKCVDETEEGLADHVNEELNNNFAAGIDINCSAITARNFIPYKKYFITDADILIKLKKVSTRKATGSDQIPNMLLKEAAPSIAHPLII